MIYRWCGCDIVGISGCTQAWPLVIWHLRYYFPLPASSNKYFNLSTGIRDALHPGLHSPALFQSSWLPLIYDFPIFQYSHYHSGLYSLASCQSWGLPLIRDFAIIRYSRCHSRIDSISSLSQHSEPLGLGNHLPTLCSIIVFSSQLSQLSERYSRHPSSLVGLVISKGWDFLRQCHSSQHWLHYHSWYCVSLVRNELGTNNACQTNLWKQA